MKKVIALLSILVIGLASVSSITMACATSTTSSTEWKVVTQNHDLNFNASYQNGVVSMSWNVFTLPVGHDWKYRKVVRSTNKSQPVYPDDGYIKYEGSTIFTSYVDNNPPQGIVYYGICAIHSVSDGKYRDCDWMSVNVNGTSDNTSNDSTTTTTPVTTSITVSDHMKVAIDKIVNDKFVPKLEASYPNIDDQVSKLETLVITIDTVINSINSANKSVFEYLKVSIQNVLDMKKVEALLNI